VSSQISLEQQRAELLRREEEVRLREERIRLREGLPHLYGFKEYEWSRRFYESRNPLNFLTAANQIGKTSVMIRKMIRWATDKSLWPELWPERTPRLFWWLTSAQDHINEEFLTKWIPEFLPKGEFKEDPIYGWKVITGRNGDIKGIQFNSGITLFFKFYTQKLENLQGRTIDAIFCDEEMPEKFWGELYMRISAYDGYFHMVFTATLGEELWRKTMEPQSPEEEKFPEALKIQVSLYDCQRFEDGTPTRWTDARIAKRVAGCSTHDDFLKRIMGRFVMTSGKRFPQFSAVAHVKPAHPIPDRWLIYGAADPGSGGEEGHPAAIAFIAVRPDMRAGRVFLGWRGDGQLTTSGDVVLKFLELKKEREITTTAQAYDFADKDFETIANRMGEAFQKADKNRERGDQILNTLFKYGMLAIYEDPELAKLVRELTTARKDENKKHAKDDLIDALRYAVLLVPWDFSIISQKSEEPKETPPNAEVEDDNPRTAAFKALRDQRRQRAANDAVEEEIGAWNSMSEPF
jgi:phage terminase large subunit-like protein